MKLFPLGMIIATPGALERCDRDLLVASLRRHAAGDWGVIDDEDKAANDEALSENVRLLSAYPIDPEKPCAGFGSNCLWIITEADRSATTFLLPDEY